MKDINKSIRISFYWFTQNAKSIIAIISNPAILLTKIVKILHTHLLVLIAVKLCIWNITVLKYKTLGIGIPSQMLVNPLQPGVAFLFPLKGGIEKQHQALMG